MIPHCRRAFRPDRYLVERSDALVAAEAAPTGVLEIGYRSDTMVQGS